jgi:hypothetical protein
VPRSPTKGCDTYAPAICSLRRSVNSDFSAFFAGDSRSSQVSSLPVARLLG